MPLTDDEVISIVRNLWSRHRDELPTHDRVYQYVRGKYGVPEVPEGAGDELKDIAKMSVKNVLSLVRDAFAQNLSVTGFRSPTASDDDPVWDLWQANRMDARQAEAHRAAITYGTSYAVVLEGSTRIRSPRQAFAVYADPQIDEWPVYALETWIDTTEKRPLRRGLLLDESHAYPVTLGTLTTVRDDDVGATQRRITVAIDPDQEAFPHGSDVCPVVRFINARDAEDMVVGEIEPLIGQQRAINVVNFDRLVVSRFGAFAQKWIIGWEPASREELLKAASSTVWTFADGTNEGVAAGQFAASPLAPYNELLAEMLAFVALTAQIPVAGVTGRIDNLAAETVALVNSPHQRKLAEKRESLGESWEQLLRLQGALHGLKVDDAAEVVWRDTEARSYAQVVDGATKLVAAGVPVEMILQDIPGWTKQRVDAAREKIATRVDPFAALTAHLDAQASGLND